MTSASSLDLLVVWVDGGYTEQSDDGLMSPRVSETSSTSQGYYAILSLLSG
jgi:hypothetical protein